MAASLYDEQLQSSEARRLDRALARSAAARREQAELKRLVESIPRSRPELGLDLLPRVRARVCDSARPRRAPAQRLAYAGAACAAVVVTFASVLALANAVRSGDEVTHLARPEDRSPAANLLREARTRVAQADFGSAFLILQTIVSDYPQDALAGEAQLEVARLQFERFANYPAAYQAYRALRERHPDMFRSSPEHANRLDVLAEARRVEYASLEEFDAATKRSSGIEALERVIARYPATMVASLAAERMADRMLVAGGLADGPPRLRALETARSRCRDPIAVARLNIEIADGYWKDLHDVDRARDIGSEALRCGNPEVVEMARAFLRDLDPDAR